MFSSGPSTSGEDALADARDLQTKTHRKSHHKSRNGCQSCKRRHIKCGEEKPVCFNCKTRGSLCNYEGPRSIKCHHVQALADEGDTFDSPGPTGNYGPLSGNISRMKDLALMHHWCVSTSLSISTAPSTGRLWQKVVPGIAFRHEFLMHAMLAVAALHSSYVYPTIETRDILIDVATHHNEALRGFREAMMDINDRNGNAMFTTAVLNVFYVFGTMGKQNTKVLDSEWISMVRGCGAVLGPAYHTVSRGPLSDLLEIGDWSVLDPDDHASEDDGRLIILKDIWASANGGCGPDGIVYDKTLYCLRQALKWMDDRAKSDTKAYWAGPSIWLNIIPEDFLELLWQRQPPALVLFAYFGALVQRLEDCWWAEGWGRKIVGAVAHYLGPYWGPRIEWPLQVAGLSGGQ